ncbi:hypothetical protein [Streptomyces sp. CB03911]|uniref:hypothetical protein n=1 Tax=Streptomyces sp. CB03911 TaxID=1804758 RepID=UPI00093DB76B|nr:hypothetical protein [Streptomyces sp. CB03911]OKI19285.1 hypothetical protein A6A07_07225 [Streptomyces sp. CB03911]
MARTDLLCAGCHRFHPRESFRETPWHGRAANCKFWDHYAMEREHAWKLEQERAKARGLRRGMEMLRRQRDAAGREAVYNDTAHRRERFERREAEEARSVYRAEVRRLQDEIERREYFHAWTSDREIPADVGREVQRRTEQLESRVRMLQAQIRGQATRHAKQRTADAACFTAMESIARALEDALPGDQWHTAHALRRLAAGEITPDEALKEAWPGES